MPDFLQYFLFVGFAGLMFLLRLDARRFGAAEWDTEDGDRRLWLSRLTWYAAGLALGLHGLRPASLAGGRPQPRLRPRPGPGPAAGPRLRRRRHRGGLRAGPPEPRPSQLPAARRATRAASSTRSARPSTTSSSSAACILGLLLEPGPARLRWRSSARPSSTPAPSVPARPAGARWRCWWLSSSVSWVACWCS